MSRLLHPVVLIHLLENLLFGELRNIIRFSSKIFLISLHKDEEDYMINMKIFFIKCVCFLVPIM